MSDKFFDRIGYAATVIAAGAIVLLVYVFISSMYRLHVSLETEPEREAQCLATMKCNGNWYVEYNLWDGCHCTNVPRPEPVK